MTHTADIALTITLKPSHYDKSWKEQLIMSGDAIRDAFQYDRMSCVAELTAHGNIHYHCLLSICKSNLGRQLDPVKAYVQRKLKGEIFGYYQMKAVTNYNGWVNYIKKASIHVVVDDYDIYAPAESINKMLQSGEENIYYRSGYLFRDTSAIAQECLANPEDEPSRIGCEA